MESDFKIVYNKQCSNCGANADEDSNFCKYCGYQLNIDKTATDYLERVEERKYKKESSKREFVMYTLIFGMSFVIFPIIMLLIFLFAW